MSPILARLREKTAQAHAKIELNPVLARLLQADLTKADYLRTLLRYLGFFRPLERMMGENHDWCARIPEYAARLRTHRLESDLRALGMSENQIRDAQECAELPRSFDLGSFFGISYVTEGSNLGGAMIARTLTRHSFINENNSSFFIGNGEVGPKLWRQFLQSLADNDSSESFRENATAAAISTFEAMDRWMSMQTSTRGNT